MSLQIGENNIMSSQDKTDGSLKHNTGYRVSKISGHNAQATLEEAAKTSKEATSKIPVPDAYGADKTRMKHTKCLNQVELQLTEGVAAFWKNKAFSDVEVHCGLDGGVVLAHRIVLASISSFLRRILESSLMKETEDNSTLIIPDVSSEDINHLLTMVCVGSTEMAEVKEPLKYLGFSHDSYSNFNERSNRKKPSKEFHFQAINKLNRLNTITNDKYRNEEENITFHRDNSISDPTVTLSPTEELQMISDSPTSLVVPLSSSGKSSLVWNYFNPLQNERTKCKSCDQEMKTFDGSTSGMLRHLRRNHPVLYNEWKMAKDSKSPRNQDPDSIGNVQHPIWGHYQKKDNDTHLLTCKGCQKDVEDIELPSLENHLKETHSETFQLYISEIDEFCKPFLEPTSKKPKKPSIRSAIWQYFKRTETRNLNECCICAAKVRCNKMGTSNMIRHLERYHTNEYDNFVSDNSRLIASNGSHVKSHAKTKKKRGPKPNNVEIDPSDRTCSDCGKFFSGRAAMRFHKRVVHSGVRPFKCEECGMTFARGDSFKGHTHSTTRSFLCTICGKTFGRKNIRDQHERAHRGDRRYNCKFCNRKFMTNQQKMNHERVHTGEKPHQVRYLLITKNDTMIILKSDRLMAIYNETIFLFIVHRLW